MTNYQQLDLVITDLKMKRNTLHAEIDKINNGPLRDFIQQEERIKLLISQHNEEVANRLLGSTRDIAQELLINPTELNFIGVTPPPPTRDNSTSSTPPVRDRDNSSGITVGRSYDGVISANKYWTPSTGEVISPDPFRDICKNHLVPGRKFNLAVDGYYPRNLSINFTKGDPRFDEDYGSLNQSYAGTRQDIFLNIEGINNACVHNILFGEKIHALRELHLKDIIAHAATNDSRAIQGFTNIEGFVSLNGMEYSTLPHVDRMEHGFYFEGDCKAIYMTNRKNLVSPILRKLAQHYHHGYYIKTNGLIKVTDNDLSCLAGRTPGQCRPQFYPMYGSPAGSRPSNNIIFKGNKISDFGHGAKYYQGGGGMTFWGNPDFTTYIEDNVIENCLGGGITVSFQRSWEHGNFVNDDGFSHGTVVIKNNTINALNNDRPGLLLSGIKRLVLDRNDIRVADRPILINGPWEMMDPECKMMQPKNISLDATSAPFYAQNMWYNGRDVPYRLFTEAELRSMIR